MVTCSCFLNEDEGTNNELILHMDILFYWLEFLKLCTKNPALSQVFYS